MPISASHPRCRFAIVLLISILSVAVTPRLELAHASGKDRIWLSRFNGPPNGLDVGISVAASPDGSRVFVTGDSRGAGTGRDYSTVAYDAGTGTVQWARRTS